MHPTHFILVDFENVQDLDLELIRGKPVHVTLLIGAKQTKMPTKLATQLHAFANQVQPVEVGGSGRNALDLTLAAYLGRTIERHPTASFAIVSRDKDFDPMIAHLIETGTPIVRSATFGAVPFLNRPKKAAAPKTAPAVAGSTALPNDLAHRQQALLGRLQNPANKHRPTTRKALFAHLKTALGNGISDEIVASTLDFLQAKRVLSINALDKVVYAKN